MSYIYTALYTVNVEIFAQYIFSRMVSDASEYSVIENINPYRLELGTKSVTARKFSSAKISTFTV